MPEAPHPACLLAYNHRRVIAGRSRSQNGVASLAYARQSMRPHRTLGLSVWTTGSSPVVTIGVSHRAAAQTPLRP
jgi:hypothetical protein